MDQGLSDWQTTVCKQQNYVCVDLGNNKEAPQTDLPS